MPCLSPLWIPNRHYSALYKNVVGSEAQKRDICFRELLSRPWDAARQYIAVPCGKCEECLRAERNSWFIRLDRELAFCRRFGFKSTFITLTVSPENYQSCITDPSKFIRRFFEKIRHTYGKSIKHFMVQEIGEKGRLHFHGVLFGGSYRFVDIHRIARDFGFAWLAPCTASRCRYVVKYIVKDLGKLPLRFQDKKYKRKFVSPHLGDYLGNFPKPSFSVRSWTYGHFASNQKFVYTIPRYYDKYLSDKDKDRRCIHSAFCIAPVTLPFHYLSFQSFLQKLDNTLDFSAVSGFLEKLSIKQSYQKWLKHRKSVTSLTDILDSIFRNLWLSPQPAASSIPPKHGSLMLATNLQFSPAP